MGFGRAVLGSNWVRAALAATGVGATLRLGEGLAIRRWARNPSAVEPEEFELHGTHHSVDTADGGAVHAVEIGSGGGPTVILGHGIAGHRGHWAPIAGRLTARGLRVVVFEQRGHGESVAGSAGFTLEGLSNDVAAVTRKLGGTGPVVLGGHSMGGIGIQAMARYEPDTFDQVAGVALVSTMADSIEHPFGDALRSEAVATLYRKLLDNKSHGSALMRAGFGADPNGFQLDYLRESWRMFPEAAMSGFGEGLEDFDLTGDIHRLTVKTIVVCGDRDNITPLAKSETLAELLPDAELQVVETAGHMIIWEQPDVVADVLHRLAVPNARRHRT